MTDVPLEISANGASPPRPDPDLADTLPTPPRRPGILVIDEEARVRTVLTVTLRQHGFHVRQAANPVEAVEEYRHGHSELDLVLLDSFMPGVGGQPMLEVLREINPAVRCCLLVANCNGAIDELRRSGAVRIFSKPVQTPELVQALWLLVANVDDTVSDPSELGLPTLDGQQPDRERRAWVRYLCQLESCCQPLGLPKAGEQWPGKLRELCNGGVRVIVTRRFEVGTLLALEMPGGVQNSSQTLLSRVVHVLPDEGSLWSHGCSFTNPLSDEELRALLA